MGKLSTNPELENIANNFADIVRKTYNSMTEKGLSSKFELKKKNIMEWEGELRINGMDVFNGPSYISTVSYYLSEDLKSKGKSCGAIIQYMEKENTEIILKSLGYRDFDDEDDESVMEQCGVFCKVVGEKLRDQLGSSSMVMSEPQNYVSSVPLGVPFNVQQLEQMEISFFSQDKNVKYMVFDITISPI